MTGYTFTPYSTHWAPGACTAVRAGGNLRGFIAEGPGGGWHASPDGMNWIPLPGAASREDAAGMIPPCGPSLFDGED